MIPRVYANTLRFIEDYTKRQGFPPTLREIGQATGVASTSTVHWRLFQMELRGLVTRAPGIPRSVRAVKR